MNTPIPTAKYTVGNKVSVKCVEAGCPPTFDGIITGVYFGRRTGELTYAVLADGIVCDGYTEDWLTPIAANAERSNPAPKT